jgi:hypothetical protein
MHPATHSSTPVSRDGSPRKLNQNTLNCDHADSSYEYLFEDFIHAVPLPFNSLDKRLSNRGKAALGLDAEPKSKDFDYLCGWKPQQGKKSEEEFRRTDSCYSFRHNH